MSTKKEAQKTAKMLRSQLKGDVTVNVKEITPGNFGVRFSPKGSRDKFKVVRDEPKRTRITPKSPRIS